MDLAHLRVAQIRQRLAESHPGPEWLEALRRDPRRGVQQLYRTAQRRLQREANERRRLEVLLERERALWQRGVKRVAGVDEAGTGPLAGPVVAAAAVFPDGPPIEGIDDSKRLDPARRRELARAIRERAAVGVGIAEVEEIDHEGIYGAALRAMQRAVLALPEAPEHLLVDARTVPGVPFPQDAFEKGDQRCYCIAAASIIAKTHRDALMDALERDYPGYGLAQHKGYPTQEHQEAIRRLGPSPVHRRSFGFLDELGGAYSQRFYALREQLRAAENPAALTRIEHTLEADRAALREPERRKLRLLLARRRRQT